MSKNKKQLDYIELRRLRNKLASFIMFHDYMDKRIWNRIQEIKKKYEK